MPRKNNAKDIKDRASAHPYSRKAHQLQRAVLRKDKLARQRSASDQARDRVVEKLVWFKFAVDSDKDRLTRREVKDLVDLYISRHDPEIAALEAGVRKNRPRPAKLDILRAIRDKDAREFAENGMELPELTRAASVKELRAWNGDYGAIEAKVKIVRFRWSEADESKDDAAEAEMAVDDAQR